jgi:hypothetical protein
MREYDEDVLRLKRNMDAVAVALKSYEAMRQLDSRKILDLQENVSNLTQQVQALTISVALARAGVMGRGPTA